MAEKENIQPEAVSPEGGDVSPEVKPEVKEEPKVEPQPQPLTEERITQIVAEQTELAKREIQSVKDRARQEVETAQRRAKLAESESAGYKSSFGELDEDVRDKVELATLRGRDQQYQTFMQDEEGRRLAESYRQSLQSSLVENVKALGIDPSDKRIDWAENETDFLAGRNKFDASVAKILKENQGEAEKKMKDDFKVLESGLRKDLGLDSVDTTTSAATGSDATFIEGWTSGKLPATKENIAKANKLLG